jgi:integrase/recombinase XerC
MVQDEEDILDELLMDKRSETTKREYRKDLRDFCSQFATSNPDTEPTNGLIREFLQLPQAKAFSLVLRYKQNLKTRPNRKTGGTLAEATINRRLAALRSLIQYARRRNLTEITLQDIENEKVVPYRDTSGISPAQFEQMMRAVNPATLKGKRDLVILRLFWTLALRRNEIVTCDVGDVDAANKRLRIYGKGYGRQDIWMALGQKTLTSIQDYLAARNHPKPTEPLVVGTKGLNIGGRMTGDGLYKLIRRYANLAGIEKIVSPHRLRHASITAALDITGGNLREVQRLSRHRNFNALEQYDDNRQGHQENVTNLLEDLI